MVNSYLRDDVGIVPYKQIPDFSNLLQDKTAKPQFLALKLSRRGSLRKNSPPKFGRTVLIFS